MILIGFAALIIVVCISLITQLITVIQTRRDEAEASPIATPTAVPYDAESDPRFYQTDSLLLIANKSHKLPDGYVPSDLTEITGLPMQDASEYMRREAASALQEMFSAAAEEGVSLYLVSAYRSQDVQAMLYNSYVSRDGQEAADTYSSRPGYSDHQTGLACDLGQTDGAGLLSQDFINTAAGQWLYQHAHEYGFVLRYPQGKEAITGYMYEPWHYRYVGRENAAAIYAVSPDESIEEYYGISGGQTYPES